MRAGVKCRAASIGSTARCLSCSTSPGCWRSRLARMRAERYVASLASKKVRGMKSCLIVDDSRVVRKVARRILEELEFAIEEAADGQLAMAVCQRRMPDAILLDWNMPVMNGIDFLRALRQMPGGAAPVVVFCTTENDIKHIEEAVGAGANEYIMKPFDTDIIQAKFQQVGLL